MIRSKLIICLALVLLSAGWAIASQARPFAGNGLLRVRPMDPSLSAGPPSLVFYREPGVGRITESPVTGIPLLSPLVNLPPGEYPLAVMGKRGGWLLVAYDDAGREGWVEMARWWLYERWEDYLKGRALRPLAGMKHERYALHAEPLLLSPRTAYISVGDILRVIEVKEEWALVDNGRGLSGWFSWKDEDGRFLVSVDDSIAPQKH